MTLAGETVCAVAVDLYGRECRGHLLDAADKLRQGLAHGLLGDVLGGVGGVDFGLEVK